MRFNNTRSFSMMLFVLLSIAFFVYGDVSNDQIIWPDSLVGIVGGREAALPPEDEPVAFIIKDDHWAEVIGRKQGKFPESYYQFLGLRYAEPPVGRFRFQRSKKLRLLGRVNGLKHGSVCPQPDPEREGKVTGSEDCLFLNIYTPKLPDSKPLLPVLLWIHGGGFRRGSASQYGGGYLARRDLVLVTLQYRLGALGYLSTGEGTLSGNVGLFDIATAISWLADYVEYFGGDPNNIIPFGQGSGGSAAVFTAISNITGGRMGGVIAMSGSALSPFSIDQQPIISAEKIVKDTNCVREKTIEMIRCLQHAPMEDLILSESAIEKNRAEEEGLVGIAVSLGTAPVVEGISDSRGLPPYFEESPEVSLSAPTHIPLVPLLTGVTKHETAGVVTGRFSSKLLDNLKKIPNFLDQVLIKKLVGVNKWSKQLKQTADKHITAIKQLTGNYEQFRPSSLLDGFNQIIEVTTDAFFNFPAFKMSDEWVKRKIPTFFYSFEHRGKLKGAEKLFKGSLLEMKDAILEDLKAVSHGSDLPYIFDLKSLNGIPDSNFNESTKLSPDDQKVRETLLDMVSQFAKTKKIQIGGNYGIFPSFITIQPQPKLETNFRECQMNMWSGIQEKLCPLDLNLSLSPNLNVDLLQPLQPSTLGFNNLFNKTISKFGNKTKFSGLI